MKKYSIFLVLILSATVVSAQNLRLDSDFGKEGRVQLEYDGFAKIFYDASYNSVYVCHSVREDGEYSNQYYYTDGIFKYDANSGLLDDEFGKDGYAFHEVGPTKRKNGGVYWHATDENLICINRGIDQKEILIYYKEDGYLKCFPKPDSTKYLDANFVHYDESKNRFLLVDGKDVCWYSASGVKEYFGIEKYLDVRTREIGCMILSVTPDSILFIVSEYLEVDDSKGVQRKIFSKVENNINLIRKFEPTRSIWNKKWDSGGAATCSYDNDFSKHMFDLYLNTGDWSKVEVPETRGVLIDFIDQSGISLYGTDERWRKPEFDEPKVSWIFEDYLLFVINIISQELSRYSLSDLLPNNSSISSVKHIGDNEFIILTSEKKRKKHKKYLYKVILE